MNQTIVSLFASTDTGLLDTFGTGGVINYAPAEFPVPTSLSSLPQSQWSIEQWSQPVVLNPNDYTQSNPLSYDGLYGLPTFTWSEPGTPTQFSIYNNPLQLGGGYAYSITNGSAPNEVDFFIASPPPINPANDFLNHPITVSLDAKIAHSIIQYANGSSYDPGYVFATVDIGFTVTFNGSGRFPYGAFSGFVQIDPWTTNSTEPVSYTSGPIGQNGVTQFIDTKRFPTDPGLPLLPADANALPDQLTYNLNNYVYDALKNAFPNYSSADRAVLLNLANWSIGSVYIGIATNNAQIQSKGSIGLAASISADVQLSNISITSNLGQIYNPATPAASVPVGDTNPKISFFDYTVGSGGQADGSTRSLISGIQDEYIYQGADSVSLTAPAGANWEFGGGSAYTTLSASTGNNIFIASSGGSDMIGGSGNDTFVIGETNLGNFLTSDTIANFHSGDMLFLNVGSIGGWSASVVLNTDTSGSFTANIFNSNSLSSGPSEVISLTDLSTSEIQSLEFNNSTYQNMTAESFDFAGTGTLSNLFTVDVGNGETWSPSALELHSVVNNGTISIDPTTITITGPLTGEGTLLIGSGSDLIIDGPVSSGESIIFTGTSATLTLSDPNDFHGSIYGLDTENYGLNAQNTIDFPRIFYDATGSVLLDTLGTLRVTENAMTVALDVVPERPPYPSEFYLSRDALDGTDVSESSVPCFLRGTMIRTSSGDVPVEDLRAGDFVMNSSGRAVRINWIGRRTYSKSQEIDENIAPIEIRAGALGDQIPDRNLYISPLHAIQCEEWLVPAASLINDVSVTRAVGISYIDYFHIETFPHDIIFANNTPVETFLDENSRKMFDNAVDVWHTFSRATTFIGVRALPLLEAGPELERLRQKYIIRTGVFPAHDQKGEFIGYLESATRTTIKGWVVKKGKAHDPVIVQVVNSGVIIATVLANRPRRDVRLAGYGNGYCGFEITLPAPLPALRRHSISIRPVGCSSFLSGSPIIIDPGISHDMLKTGGLDALIDAAVRGAPTSEDVQELSRTLIQAGKRIQVFPEFPTLIDTSITQKDKNSFAGLILFFDEFWPTCTLDSGSKAVMSHVIAFRELGYSVVFHATSGPPRSKAAVDGLLSLKALGVNCYSDIDMNTEAVIKLFQHQNVNLVYIHRFAVAVSYMGLVKRHLRTAKIIYALADLHYLRLERQAKITLRPDLLIKSKEVKAAEIFSITMADSVITHSHYEAQLLQKSIPWINVHVVTWNQPVESDLPAETSEPTMAFIGGANHAPNFDAVQHLAQDILPSVWRYNEMIKCFVIGSEWPKPFCESLDKRIITVGHQENLREFLKNVCLTVAPLRFGSGIKGKVIESFAAGRPCVMTSIASEGIRLSSEFQCLTGDGDDLVMNIVSMHRDKQSRRKVGILGLEFVRSEFSQKVVTQALKVALAANPPASLINKQQSSDVRGSWPNLNTGINRISV